MKQILTILCLSCLLISSLSAQRPSRDSMSVTIVLPKTIIPDSVLVIFDRYDLTGAGVINKVFYPSENKILVEKVPPGKYYIDVYNIGIDRQNVSKITTIGQRRSNKLCVRFKPYEQYTPGNVVIPSSEIDFSNLVVTQHKLRR